MVLSKIQNPEHKYGTTRAQLPKKADGAQSSILFVWDTKVNELTSRNQPKCNHSIYDYN